MLIHVHVLFPVFHPLLLYSIILFQWKYRVKFDGKGLKVLSGHHIAYREPISCFLKVGTRVAGKYDKA